MLHFLTFKYPPSHTYEFQKTLLQCLKGVCIPAVFSETGGPGGPGDWEGPQGPQGPQGLPGPGLPGPGLKSLQIITGPHKLGPHKFTNDLFISF